MRAGVVSYLRERLLSLRRDRGGRRAEGFEGSLEEQHSPASPSRCAQFWGNGVGILGSDLLVKPVKPPAIFAQFAK